MWRFPRSCIFIIIRRKTVMQRSYQGEYTRSHQNTEVKHLWAGLVLGRVISWEPPVTLCFCVSRFCSGGGGGGRGGVTGEEERS